MTKRISETELILNPNGTIYHLNLLPDEIADTIIVVGDQGRVPLVSKHFDKIEVKKNHREFLTHTGYIGDKKISVLSTGIGSDNIDIVMNELDALANIDFTSREVKEQKTSLKIIRIGTSGSIQYDLDIDTIVMSESAIGLDNLMNFYEFERETILDAEIKKQLNIDFLNPYYVSASDNLIKKFGYKFYRGITATCCGFYSPQGRKLRAESVIKNLISKLNAITISGKRIANFEMETSAIYGLSKLLGHEALSINAVLGNRIKNTFSKNPEKIIEKAITETLEIIA